MVEKPRVRERIELSPLRRIIAERMHSSLQSTAQVTLMRECIVDGLVEFRESIKRDFEEKTGSRLTYTDILVKLTATLLRKHPLLNSALVGDYIEVYEDVNIGVAVALDHGLVVPVVRNADKKSLEEISMELKDLAERARAGTLTLEDVTGGTFTITNLGMYGVDGFTPILNPPQTSILGVGRIQVKPIIVEGEIKPARVAWLSLTFDHRVVDGHTAALLLADIASTLESRDRVAEAVGYA